MSTVEFNASEWDISQMLNKLPDLCERKGKEVMKRTGDIVKKNLQKRLPRSTEDHANYDGTRPRVHVEDDIKIKTYTKDGYLGVTLHGGKKTAFKWHLLNDGTRNPDGSVHTPATHFIDDALKDSEKEIDTLIDTMIAGLCDEDLD